MLDLDSLDITRVYYHYQPKNRWSDPMECMVFHDGVSWVAWSTEIGLPEPVAIHPTHNTMLNEVRPNFCIWNPSGIVRQWAGRSDQHTTESQSPETQVPAYRS